MIFYWIGQLVNRPKLLRWLRVRTLRAPRSLVFLLVSLLGFGLYVFDRSNRKRIKRNMSELMPQLSRRELGRKCRRYIMHEVLTIYEQAIEYRRALMRRGKDQARFHYEGREHLDEALKLGRGVILYTPHLGNYFYQYWSLSQAYNCLTVVTAGSDELRMLFAGLYWSGLKGYDYDRTPPLDLVRNLRTHLRGNGVLYLLGDFWRPEFPDCTLFGKPSKAPGGTMILSLLHKVPVIPFYGVREGWYDHRLVFEPAVHLYERYTTNQKAEALEELARIMERLIRRKPEQWLFWFNVHDRWAAAEAKPDKEAI
ncbi:MAG: lysophospholipid acyltransferase family protein [Paenibacillaceae bacterium]|nr:lysophospholipid acyltransferase family protein [Paenibacillaceae bacterium]